MFELVTLNTWIFEVEGKMHLEFFRFHEANPMQKIQGKLTRYHPAPLWNSGHLRWNDPSNRRLFCGAQCPHLRRVRSKDSSGMRIPPKRVWPESRFDRNEKAKSQTASVKFKGWKGKCSAWKICPEKYSWLRKRNREERTLSTKVLFAQNRDYVMGISLGIM